jgi:hypothetical protein
MLKTVSSITNAIGALNYKGTWNASTNSPALASGVGTKGDYYVVSVAGSTNLDGETLWGVGDWAVYNGAAWQKVEGGNTINATTVSASTSVTTPVIQATSSAGGTLKNNGGTAQLQWGSGGGSNLSLEVATNINPANAAVAISPTGTGTVTINPATASTMNNVAIGGSTPLAGTFTAITAIGSTAGAVINQLTLSNNGGSNNGGVSLTLTDAGAETKISSLIDGPNENSGASLLFYTSSSTAGSVERMRIGRSGNVNVTVAGTGGDGAVNIQGATTDYQGLSLYYSASSPNASARAWQIAPNYTGYGKLEFLISASNSTAPTTSKGYIDGTTGAYVAVSDLRAKKNITDLTYGLAEVLAMRPVIYNMIEEEDGADKHLGFIAQEIKLVMNEAVSSTSTEEELYGLDKSGLVPVLVKAIQEQQAIISNLTTRLKVLETAKG